LHRTRDSCETILRLIALDLLATTTKLRSAAKSAVVLDWDHHMKSYSARAFTQSPVVTVCAIRELKVTTGYPLGSGPKRPSAPIAFGR
jgi:hypothetical protein